MKKSILVILVVVALVSNLFLPASAASTSYSASAASTSVNSQSAKKYISNDFGTISVKDHINIGGNQRNLYETYDNPDVSLIKIKATLSDYINTLQHNYGLADLNSQNYENYVDAANSYLQSLGNNVTDSIWNGYNALQSFVDIFENNKENNEIYNIVNEYNNAQNSQDRNSYLNNINDRLPSFDAKIPTSVLPHFKVKSFTAPNINVSASCTYATQYATSYNGNYKSFSEDCTNFASQILFSGGVSQINTGNVTTGWWYQRTILPIRTFDTNSNTWSLARYFANYEGKYHATTSFNTFSLEVQKGDFIGLDYTDDGDVDHVGFVTDTGGWTGSYWDFEVAQHTNNYCAWVSSSTNGWETNDNGINTFYILRRN